LQIVFWVTFLSWVVFEWISARKANTRQSKGKFSYKEIYSGLLIIIGIFVFLFSIFWETVLNYSKFASTVSLSYTFVMGTGMVWMGMCIRFLAIKRLGGLFTTDITVHNNHKLIKNDIYKYLRHPSYLGLLLSCFGLAMMILHIFPFLVFLFLIAVYTYRAKVEEKVLIKTFRGKYINYKRKTLF